MVGAFGADDNTDPTHVELDQYRSSPRDENPAASPFNITVSVPDCIEIKMVDASTLGDYEIWVFIASIISNAVIGFLVAYFQAIDAKSSNAVYIGWTWIVFFILFVIALANAIMMRRRLKKKGRNIQLKTSSASIS